MRKHPIVHLWLCGFVLLACNPGTKLTQGAGSRGQAYQADGLAGEDAEALPASAPAEGAGSLGENSPKENVDPDLDAEDEKAPVAMEPTPIGGAYLTCRYPSGQMQGSETYRMDCEVAPTATINALILTASFFKVDAQGNRTALSVVTQDLATLKWSLQESAATVPFKRVQLVLSILGAININLETTVSAPLALTRAASYWLGGEPTNTLSNGMDEDCVEFSNAAMKQSHQATSGLVSGALGRMNDVVCSTASIALCRNISAGDSAPKWALSTRAGVFAQATAACAQGYAFGFPLSEAEIREVITLVDRNPQPQSIWVNLTDRMKENEFVVQYR